MRRRIHPIPAILALWGAAIVCLGCGDDPAPAPPSQQGPPPRRIVERPIDSSQWDESRAVPARDGGRVDVSPAKDWTVPPARPGYIVWFTLKRDAQLPRILVSAEAATGPETLTRDNVISFAETMAKDIEQKVDVKERVEPLMIGDRPCIRYVRMAKMRGVRETVQRQVLITHVNGRRYTVDLQVLGGEPEKLIRHRNAGYAVMAGMKFKES